MSEAAVEQSPRRGPRDAAVGAGGPGASRGRTTTRSPRHHIGRPTRDSNLTGWLFILPALLAFAVFIAYPVARMFYLSLQKSDGFGDQTFAGFHNYSVLWGDPVFRQAARVTIEYTVCATILQTSVPLVLAILVYSGPRRSGIVYRTLIFLPAAISLTVAGLIWRLGLTPTFGAVNRSLVDLGLGRIAEPWLSDSKTVVPTIIAVSLWQSCGLFMLIFYAGLGGIDPAIGESARIDGAGPIRQAWSITIPMLRSVTEIVVILNVINGFKVFDLNYVMTSGGPDHASETLSTYTYLLTFGSNSGGVTSFGYGSAVSVVVFITAAVASLILWRFRRSNV